jgi:hypothetical protein
MNPTGAGLIVSALLLASCAPSSNETADRGQVVIGSGSAQEREEIEASNQQIFQTERSGVFSQTAPIIPATPAASESAPASSATPPNTP